MVAGLASRAVRWFSATPIHKAQAYVRDRRVKITALAARTAIGRVRELYAGTQTVNIAAPTHRTGLLRVGCSCPDGGRGEACQHVYATLLALDARQVDLGIGVSVAALEVGELWLEAGEDAEWDDEDHDDEDNDELPVPAAPAAARRAVPALASAPGAGRAARGPAWSARLEWLDSLSPARTPARPFAIEYHLTAEDPLDPGGTPRVLPAHVEVVTHQRAQRQNGALGPRTPLRLWLDGDDVAPGPGDAEALAALRLGAPLADEAGAAPWVEAARSARGTLRYRGARIHAGILDRVMPVLAATDRLGWVPAHDEPVECAPEWFPLRWDGDTTFALVVSIRVAGRGLAIDAALVRGDERLSLAGVTVFFGGGCLAIDDRLIRVEAGASLAQWWAIAGREPLTVPRSQLTKFVERLAGLPELPRLELEPAVGWSVEAVAPTPHLELEELADRTGFIATVVFRYRDVRAVTGAARGFALDPVNQRLHPIDRAAEVAHRAALRGLGEVRGTGDLVINTDQLAGTVDTLETAGWQVWLRAKRVRSGGTLKTSVVSGIDWFEIALVGSIADVPVDALALIDALRDGQQLVRLRDGSHGILPAAWRQHVDLAELGSVEDGLVKVPRNRALRLDMMLDALPEVDRDARFCKLRDRLHDFAGVVPHPEPAGFVGELRGYQREGLGWLAFLRELGFGGCLADDMGLGKTVQVLAAIVESQQQQGGARRPALVVAPRSVVWNWVDEAAKFAPGLRVLDYSGPLRGLRAAELADADLIVTSYATMRLDLDALSQRTFGYVILDEAQSIKNPDSQLARAARVLRGEHRLALTGTPVENHLGDLGSIFEFLNPGMLGDVDALRRLNGRAAAAPGELAPLARALRPFMLRRTKAQVLPELPARSEQVLMCRLEGPQRKFYDQLREGYRASLLAKVETDGMARSAMHVLEALLRLRQAACAPELVTPARAKDGSAKLDLLLEQLAEVCAEGHKALVFSQFTSFLTLVRARLDEAGIVHEYLDGQTRDRKARVERFQSDPACQVFVISLKAGGTGLNLTAASYVYLLDPWWNPAVEAQAIDRTHRLGQARAVTAYRVIAEDTVEDKILELQRSKRALLDGLFAEDAGQLASLTAADLAVLLGP